MVEEARPEDVEIIHALAEEVRRMLAREKEMQKTNSNGLDLPEGFVEHIKRKGKKVMSLTEVVEEYKTWKRRSENE